MSLGTVYPDPVMLWPTLVSLGLLLAMTALGIYLLLLLRRLVIALERIAGAIGTSESAEHSTPSSGAAG